MQNFQEKCGATICKDLKGIENGAPLCPCPECVCNGEWVLFDSHTESVYEAEVTLYYNIRI